MKTSIIHPDLGPVTVSQTARSRRISIAVKPSGEVRLSYPIGVSAKRALAFLDSRIEWILASKARFAKRGTPRVFSKSEIENLRTQAKHYLPERIAEISRAIGLPYRRVTIRATRSKWGSCNAHGDISLSLFLMTLPEHLRDYIIIHELCHTVHHNHSARFHALVDHHVAGREKELQRELRGHRS